MSIKKTQAKLNRIDVSLNKVFDWQAFYKRPDGKPQPVLSSLAFQLRDQRRAEAEKIGRKKTK